MIPKNFAKASGKLQNILSDIDLAFRKARGYLFNEIRNSTYEKRGVRNGDGSSIHDAVVFDRFYREVAERHNMLLICEEQTRQARLLNRRSCDNVLIIDPIDGTRNMLSGMTFGVNVAFGAMPTSGDFTLGHLQGVFVADYLTQKRYIWLEGCEAWIDEARYDPSLQWEGFAGASNIFEVPDEASYLFPTYRDGEKYQKNLLRLFREIFPDAQRRAVDCTGLRILEVATGNLLAYGDVRRATSIWDTIPSVRFLLEHSPHIICMNGSLTTYSKQTPLLRRENDAMMSVIDGIGDEIIVLPLMQAELLRRSASTRDIFVVHGRDLGTAEQIARFLERELQCTCTLLKDKANCGETIIQKLKRYSDVKIAVVVLSPDDEGRLAGTSDVLKPRARQNVIFEHGLFYGLIGQENVVAVFKGVEKPSDIEGILQVTFDDQGGWQHALKREIEHIIAKQSAAPYTLSARR